MSARLFPVGAVPLCLALLWLVSSMVATYGIVLFAAGVLGLAAVLVALYRGRPRPLFGYSLVLMLAATLIACLEMALRAAPDLLRGSAALYAYSGYHCAPGGIYRPDTHLGQALRPAFAQRIYWNGHWWDHRTNAAGYRGEAVAQADAVFLGDSMVYGHGVENDQTVPSRFAAHTGLAVANLGQQGTCLVQMWLRLRHLGLQLGPRLVFVCCHPNDVTDAIYWYSQEELRRFVDSPVPAGYEPLALPKYRPEGRWGPGRLWDEYLALPLRSARVIRFLLKRVRRQPSVPPQAPPQDPSVPYVPSAEERAAPFAPWADSAPEGYRLGWQAHVHALTLIKQLCDEQGARLVLFDLGHPAAFVEATERLAARLGVEYVPAGRTALGRALAGDDVYLANDGHWSAPGCDLVARELARALRLTCRRTGSPACPDKQGCLSYGLTRR